MGHELSSFPSDKPWQRPLLCAYYSLVLTLITTLISLRLCTIGLRSLHKVSFARWLIILLLAASWLFAFSSIVLVFGVGSAASAASCITSIWLCIVLYFTSKALIYIFLMERLFVVVVGKRSTGRFSDRLRNGWYLVSLGFLASWVGVLALMIYARNAHLSEDGSCHIGIKLFANIPLIVVDSLFHAYLAGTFCWFLYKAGSLHLSTSKTMLLESTLASAFGLVSTICNFSILAAERGHQAAHICLAACLTDVVVSAVVFYYVTRHASHDRGQSNPTAEVYGHTTVPIFLTGDADEPLSKSETRLSAKPPKSERFVVTFNRHHETVGPDTPASEVDMKIP